jgi:hypothetical protein
MVYKSFYIAGLEYYESYKIQKKLQIGDKLKLKTEPKNRFDENAVEIYYKKHKLGYIPKKSNYSIAQILNKGYNIFKAYIQNIDENGIKVAIVIKDKK